MFSENLKSIRKSKGFSQEELSIKLNVVRQTISKWEKGLSVPDADMLIKIAEVFEVPVSELLGSKIENECNVNDVAEQLSRINEHLTVKNHRSRKIWKSIVVVVIGFVVFNIILAVVGMIAFNSFKSVKDITTNEQSEIVVIE